MFAGQDAYVSSDPSQWDVERMAHGMTVVALAHKEHGWELDMAAPENRRITMDTEMIFTGPVAGHRRLQTPQHKKGHTVRGMVHNCSGGKTPWGTVLTCEENILYYFGGSCSDSKGFRTSSAITFLTLKPIVGINGMQILTSRCLQKRQIAMVGSGD